MRVGQDRAAAGGNGRLCRRRRGHRRCVSATLGIQHGHFFRFAILLGPDHGNILPGSVENGTNLAFLFRRVEGRVRFEYFHEVVNFNTEHLFPRLDFAFQKHHVRLRMSPHFGVAP
jgi:hypothetical protein